jgi:hypothetical protein
VADVDLQLLRARVVNRRVGLHQQSLRLVERDVGLSFADFNLVLPLAFLFFGLLFVVPSDPTSEELYDAE